jgi:hypothetical protein
MRRSNPTMREEYFDADQTAAYPSADPMSVTGTV